MYCEMYVQNIEILQVTGEVHRRNKYFLRYKQLNTFYHFYVHKCLDSDSSNFFLVNRYIIFNKFDKHIQPHMIMVYTSAIFGLGPQA